MDQIKIGKFIAELRKETNLTQEALGEKLGVTNKTVSRWENGHYLPDVEMLQLLSKEFHVTINELISGERIEEIQFKEKAEKNIVNLMSDSAFTDKERIAFYRKKWQKENLFVKVLFIVIYAGLFAIFYVSESYFELAFLNAVSVAFWIIHYNKMMAYIEERVYVNKNKKK